MKPGAKATFADLDALVALEIACFSEPWRESTLAEALSDEKYLVLLRRDDWDAPMAYLIGWEVAGEAELARIGVAPGARGQGWGRQILDEALQLWRSRGASRVFLEVRASNLMAQRLYLSHGFELVGKRARYYENDEDALVFALDLAPLKPTEYQ